MLLADPSAQGTQIRFFGKKKKTDTKKKEGGMDRKEIPKETPGGGGVKVGQSRYYPDGTFTIG